MMEWERFILAFLVGGMLSFCGSLVQLTTRNELSSPSTLGFDGLSVLFVMLAYALSLGGATWDLSLLAFGLGSLVAGFLWFSSTRLFQVQDLRLILLLGLSVNLLVGSLFSVMQFLAMGFNKKFPDQLWFGRIQTLDFASLITLIALLLVLFGFLYFYRHQWRALLLGPGLCRGFGIPIEQMLRISLIVSYLVTLWVVVHFGVFGFLGLLFPLLLRQLSWYRGRPEREMTDGAALAGLVFAILDQLCFHFTFYGAEIPVGLPASLLGASALVLLLWKRHSTR
jgi:iron complex transport system permease protein